VLLLSSQNNIRPLATMLLSYTLAQRLTAVSGRRHPPALWMFRRRRDVLTTSHSSELV
jgi:hypothetical protein